MADRTRDLVLSAMFIAAGVILPSFFHALGLGAAFLPMFWPVAVAGFFLPLPAAILTGFLTPVVSFLITGMPPPPILYRMIVELAMLSASISLLQRRLGIFLTVASGLVVSLLAGFGGSLLIAPILGLPPAFYAAATMLRGLPGIAAILFIVPLITGKLKSNALPGNRHGNT